MLVSQQACVDYACECVRLAALTDDADIRAQLLEMARNWKHEAQQMCSDARWPPPFRRGKIGLEGLQELAPPAVMAEG